MRALAFGTSRNDPALLTFYSSSAAAAAAATA